MLNSYVLYFDWFVIFLQTIVKKVSVLMDGSDSILRFNRLYYTYLRSVAASGSRGGGVVLATSSSPGSGGIANGDATAVEHYFGRPLVLQRLGLSIMNVKV
jgi:hypothetical protein